MIVLYGYIDACHLYWKSNIYDYPEILIAMTVLHNMAFVKQFGNKSLNRQKDFQITM